MTAIRPTDSRDPEETRRQILKAAQELISRDGAASISVSEVARVAGINRGTAYLHFGNRDELVTATVKQVSEDIRDGLYESLGSKDLADWLDHGGSDMSAQLADFFTNNAELIRVWLSEVLFRGNAKDDPLWRAWIESSRRIAKTELSQQNVDAEVLALITLGAHFLWPLYIEADTLDERERTHMSARLSKEIVRLGLFGSIRPEKLPKLAAHIDKDSTLA